jgi:hypothetical protein
MSAPEVFALPGAVGWAVPTGTSVTQLRHNPRPHPVPRGNVGCREAESAKPHGNASTHSIRKEEVADIGPGPPVGLQKDGDSI